MTPSKVIIVPLNLLEDTLPYAIPYGHRGFPPAKEKYFRVLIKVAPTRAGPNCLRECSHVFVGVSRVATESPEEGPGDYPNLEWSLRCVSPGTPFLR